MRVLWDVVDSWIPSRPLSWLVEPLTAQDVDPESRIPLDSDPDTEAWLTVTPCDVSTSTPLDAEPVAVTASTVTADEESTRTPARF